MLALLGVANNHNFRENMLIRIVRLMTKSNFVAERAAKVLNSQWEDASMKSSKSKAKKKNKPGKNKDKSAENKSDNKPLAVSKFLNSFWYCRLRQLSLCFQSFVKNLLFLAAKQICSTNFNPVGINQCLCRYCVLAIIHLNMQLVRND